MGPISAKRRQIAKAVGGVRLIATGLEASGWAWRLPPLHPVEATRAQSEIDVSHLNESNTAHRCLEVRNRCRRVKAHVDRSQAAGSP